MKLLDLTLREGEQRPGVEYTVDQKVAAARELDALGVDYIQVGFPVADDRTRRVCERVDLDAKTTGIARAVPADVDAAIDAGVDVVNLFAPTSDRQLEHVLGRSREELLDTVVTVADRARDHGVEVHFDAMDGFRTDPADLDALFDAIDAELYTMADTVGGRTPAGVVDHLEAIETSLDDLGVHFHDDLGVATANTLAAARLGVARADVSVAGLGERAGNAVLEEVVAAAVVGDEPFTLDVDERRLLPTARAVLDALDEDVEPAKALLGDEVFAHESGLHTAAMLDDPATFEPFDPARFGGQRRLLFGSATGTGAARRLLERAGREPTEERVGALLDRLDDVEEELSLEAAVALAGEVA
ncbi:LeuA family protein [Haloarchaeobius salinus]|uniref:LeuA family protein n=1 Tax=Haloarchaeobius salinus TaxID=1198298 RepID=UPI00210E4713|nr:citramalate synthase [Haloarchaeobius salinus]